MKNGGSARATAALSVAGRRTLFTISNARSFRCFLSSSSPVGTGDATSATRLATLAGPNLAHQPAQDVLHPLKVLVVQTEDEHNPVLRRIGHEQLAELRQSRPRVDEHVVRGRRLGLEALLNPPHEPLQKLLPALRREPWQPAAYRLQLLAISLLRAENEPSGRQEPDIPVAVRATVDAPANVGRVDKGARIGHLGLGIGALGDRPPAHRARPGAPSSRGAPLDPEGRRRT